MIEQHWILNWWSVIVGVVVFLGFVAGIVVWAVKTTSTSQAQRDALNGRVSSVERRLDTIEQHQREDLTTVRGLIDELRKELTGHFDALRQVIERKQDK